MTRGWSRLTEARRIAADDAGRLLLKATLEHVCWNVSAAARELRMSARNLRRAAQDVGLLPSGERR